MFYPYRQVRSRHRQPFARRGYAKLKSFKAASLLAARSIEVAVAFLFPI
jgi:hypothetical protein